MLTLSRRRKKFDITLSFAADVLLIVLSCSIVIYFGNRNNWFEHFYQFSRAYENYKIDDIALIFVNLSIGGAYISLKRYFEQKAEARRRLTAENRLEFLALHDALTGLANRHKFDITILEVLALQANGGTNAALFLIDLDRFKPINDLHGHPVGDRVLQMAAGRINDTLLNDEFCARLGGDEFAIIIFRFDDDDDLARIATRILKAFELPFDVDNIQCKIGASVGIAIARTGTLISAEELVKRADMALYRAKAEGRGRYRYFEKDMDAKVKERSRLELELPQAIANKEIKPYYQPLVNLADGRVEGYELLARWDHPGDGLISPEQFIPIAEDTGLIGEMTLMLLGEACEDSRAWPDGTYISINISPIQLRDISLPAKLMTVLGKFAFDPTRLEVEITENALIYDLDTAREVLLELKALGISLALDDFGTGYSSLQYLRELPFDKIKIDRSFVLSMNEAPESRKIVDAVVGLGKSLGLKITAEGIESAENAQWLTEIGCRTGQGFLYGRATDAKHTLCGTISTQQATILRDMLAIMQGTKPSEESQSKIATAG